MESRTTRGLRREEPKVGGAQSRRSPEAEGRGGDWGYWVKQTPTVRGRDLCPLSQRAPRCWVSRTVFSFSESDLTRMLEWSK